MPITFLPFIACLLRSSLSSGSISIALVTSCHCETKKKLKTQKKMSHRTKRQANQKCHAAVIKLLERKEIPRKDRITGRDTLRVRCRTHEQMGKFPVVLESSIEDDEIEMLAFPKSNKGIKTHVFFICPKDGKMNSLQSRFLQQDFKCEIRKAKALNGPEEPLQVDLEKRGWKCTSCFFTNLEWRSSCYNCKQHKPNKLNMRELALQPVPRPHDLLGSWRRNLAVTVSNE